MGKFIRNVVKTEGFTLTECTDGYYLWDHVVEMNIAMRSKTEQEAFIEGLDYYQKRLEVVKKDYNDLNRKVESFLDQFDRED